MTMGQDAHPAVRALTALDDQLLEVESRHRQARRELERKYRELYRQNLAQRHTRLCRPAVDASQGVSGPSASAGRKATPAIPGFWKIVLQNADEFQELIEEHDEPVLDYLQDIRWEPLEEESAGFRLRFLFEQNPFFSNETLDKEYVTELKNPFIDRLTCAKITSSKIKWLPGKDVTVEMVSKKGAGRKRTKAKREVPRKSFFRTFFRDLGPDEDVPEEEMEDLEEDEDALADLMDDLIDEDYEAALCLREQIIPHAVRWYTGDACEDDDDEDDDDDEEDDEDGSAGDNSEAQAPIVATNTAEDAAPCEQA